MRRAPSLILPTLLLLLAGCPEEPYDGTDPKPPATTDGQDAADPQPGDSTAPADAGQDQVQPEAGGQPVPVPETLSSGQGGTSPADVFYRAKRAFDGRAFGDYYDLLTPAGRRNLLPMVSFAAGMVGAVDPDSTQQLEALFARHGLVDEAPAGPSPTPADDRAPGLDLEAMAAKFDDVEDPRALFGELMGFVVARQPPPTVVGLEDLVVEGERARAQKLVEEQPGRRSRDVIHFARVEGRWFIDVPTSR